jgi:hypothetical protein
MCNIFASIDALGTLVRGEMPTVAPVGCNRPFARDPDAWGGWNNYRAMVMSVRSQTSADTLVANALNTFPYESINGPAGRLSPFLAESGVCWMTQVHLDLDSEFADALIRSRNSIVVWKPARIDEEGAVPLHRVASVIREYFEPETRFGDYEIWRRKAMRSD